MNYNTTSFKKKLGFVSLFVLASCILSQPGVAMNVDMQGEKDENSVNQSTNPDPGSKPSRKRKERDTEERDNKKNPDNKKFKIDTPTAQYLARSSAYSGQGPRAMGTPAAAHVLANMGGALAAEDDTEHEPAFSAAPVPLPTGGEAKTTTTTIAEAPTTQTYPTLEQIQDFIKSAPNDDIAQTKIIDEYYEGRYRPLLRSDKIDFLNWKNPNQTLQGRCTNNDKWAHYVLHHWNQIEKHFPNLIQSIQERANQGYAAAQNNLGLCYKKGVGVGQDLQKAVELYTAAANQGCVAAQNNLGTCYQLGLGIDKDSQKAVELYTVAANQGCVAAQNNLGTFYNHGLGIDKDSQKAFEFYTLSANQGYSAAQSHLGTCYKNGVGVGQDLKKALELYTLAANQGDVGAQSNLGYCYEKGVGVPKNMATALFWKMASKETGNNLFLAAHIWYRVLKTQPEDEKCATKLSAIRTKLADSSKHFEEKIAEEEKQLWPLQGITQAYQSVNETVKKTMDLFDRISKVLKQGFMVPLVGVSRKVNEDYQKQASPRQLDLYYGEDMHYLSFGEKAIQCQKDLIQLEKEFEGADKILKGLEQNHYGLLISQKERELEDKRTGSNPDQEECKKLAEKIGYFSSLRTNVRKDRERLEQHKQETRSFIRLTAKDRQDIWHEEYPAVPQKQ